MSDFVNTIELQGDEETLHALLSDSQTNYYDDKLTYVRPYGFRQMTSLENIELSVAKKGTSIDNNYAFKDCYRLKKIKMPLMNSIGSYMLESCYYLSDVYIPNVTTINSYSFDSSPFGLAVLPNAINFNSSMSRYFGVSGFDITNTFTISNQRFYNAYNLSTLILRSSTLCPLNNTSSFDQTPIAAGYGWIYVPDALVDTYKAASNWSTFASRIVPLSQYPKEFEGGTITDTWAQIFAAEEDGTYKTKYSVGDTKVVNINGACVIMQIVAFDEDDLADNTGKAKITWLSQGLVGGYFVAVKSGTVTNWANSDVRKYIDDKFYLLTDSNVRAHIKKVVKKTWSSNDNGIIETEDFVWLPSFYEMCGTTGDNNNEKTGSTYSNFFTTNESRVKYTGPCSTGGTNSYWLRSWNTGATVRYLAGTGSSGGAGSIANYNRFSIGFCT